MNVLQIYKKYKIPPYLQQHMLSVSSVAFSIADKFNSSLKKEDIIKACLLHDMGNIIKFDLSNNLFNLSEKDLNHLRKVKKEFEDKYGFDDHEATYTIVSEIGVSENILKLIKSFGFSNSCNIAEGNNFEKKICGYSDMRVVPYGVVSLQKRLSDIRVRYESKYSINEFNMGKTCLERIEKQIFEQINIKPSDITDESIKKIVEELKDINF